MVEYLDCVLGVADGVGGWRQYGVDPGEFSYTLMNICQKIINSGRFNRTRPDIIISQAYYELSEKKTPITGKFNKILYLNQELGKLNE